MAKRATATVKAEATQDDPEEKVSQTTAVANWDEELARDAEVAAGMEANAGGGQYFSTQGGILAFNDSPLPDNQMAVVIVDSILENVFYADEYDPNNPAPPTCFAFGRDDGALAPHPTVVERGQAQHETCRGCPMNVFGTADKGRGKACRNTRRLALIPAGDLTKEGRFTANREPDDFARAPMGFLKLPVTSVKGYANFVKQAAGALKRPPHGIFSTVKEIPDAKTQFKVLFSPLATVPNDVMAAVMARRAEAVATIETPYPLDVEERDDKPAARGAKGKAAAGGGRPPVKKAAPKKY